MTKGMVGKMKRMAGVFICFLIIFGILASNIVYGVQSAQPVASVCREPLSEEVLYNGTLEGAADYLFYAKQGGVIVLRESVKLESGISLHSVNDTTSYIYIDGKVTVDLNGFSITQHSGSKQSINPAIVVPKGSSLTVIDSSQKTTGTVNGVQYGVMVDGGYLEVSGGIIKAQAQSSFAPDDAEVALKVINNGEAVIKGGRIIYHGSLDDGRTYFDKSCAVLADDTGILSVSGGIIEGEIAVRDNNLTIKGGTFDWDITPYLAWNYRAAVNKGIYTVENCMPEVKGLECQTKTDIVMKSQDGKENIDRIEIVCNNENTNLQSIRVDITELIEFIRMSEQEKTPEIIINTDFIRIILDGNDTASLVKDSQDKNVIFTISKNFALSEVITDKIENAVYEVSFGITDDKGSVLTGDMECLLTISHKSRNAVNGIELYRFDGKDLKTKNSTLIGNDINCRAKNGERLVIAEGIVMMITGRSLELRGTISIVFYAQLSGVNPRKVSMLFWDSPQTVYTAETAQRVVPYTTKDANGYKFVYSGISAKEMSKLIYARLYATDMNGNPVYGSIPQSGYGVTTYATNMLENQKLKPLLVSMLNYGTAAQNYYGSQDIPANDILIVGDKYMDYSRSYTSTAQTIPEENGNGSCLTKINGKTLILEDDISIGYYVYPAETVEEMGILFWNEDAFQSTNSHIMGTQSRRVTDYTLADNNYMFYQYDNITSYGMFENIYARVYVKQDGIFRYSDIEKYSVKDYAANQINKNQDAKLINLLRTMLLYGEEAQNFFGIN